MILLHFVLATHFLLPEIQSTQRKPPIYAISTELNTKEKLTAFSVLQSKCNVCHVKRNRSKIFTLENMDDFSLKINEQVFIKKRMPKGDFIKLSEEESIKLKTWLNTLK